MITKTMLKGFRVDFKEAVSNLESKYGIRVELNTIRYGESYFKVTLTATEVSEDGIKKVDTSEFDIYKQLLGLNGNIGDSYINEIGKRFTIVELKPRSRKYPVIVKDESGKQWKISVSTVNYFMGRIQ